jgi:drug/metabolite transporter (DMT)-like permease
LDKKQISLAGFLIAITGAIMFSTKAVIVKKAFADIKIDPLSLLALRMLCSLPFYIVAAFWKSNRQQSTLSQKQVVQIIVLGLFGYYISSLLDFYGLQYISAGLERLILFLYPTFVILINHFYFKQSVTGKQKWALGLTYTGIALAFVAEIQIAAHSNFIWGCLLILICAVTYAVYIAGSARMIPVTGAGRFTAYAMLSAAAGVLIHFLLKGNYAVLQGASAKVWLYGLLLAIIATVLPSFLVSLGLKKIGANNAVIVSSIGPISTILQAYFILGEPITVFQLTGTGFVIAGILLISLRKKSA